MDSTNVSEELNLKTDETLKQDETLKPEKKKMTNEEVKAILIRILKDSNEQLNRLQESYDDLIYEVDMITKSYDRLYRR
jgi:hypothetical protein